LKPIFRLSGSSRLISVNAFEIGQCLLVAGRIRDDGFTAGETEHGGLLAVVVGPLDPLDS
jgi:hypothetical protein